MVNSTRVDENRRMLRARDAMDREYARPLDVPALAAIACVAPSTFIRSFRRTFGETPHHYLRRRRIERAMYLLRTGDDPITEISLRVGFHSLGTFSRTFRDLVGESPSSFRASAVDLDVPSHFVARWTRPSDFGEAARTTPTVT